MEKKNGKAIIIFFTIVLLVIVGVIIFAVFQINNDKKEDINKTENEEIKKKDDLGEKEEETSEQSELINYIEIEMPNLIGKSYMDIYYTYNIKEDIVEQLIEANLEGTTYNLNTIKYISDGSILVNGYYIIEGYGHEIEKQEPKAGTKIKLLNDGEGNVSLEKDIHIYIKGGGRTEKIEIDKDKREELSSTKNNNLTEEDEASRETNNTIVENTTSNENIEEDKKEYIHTALSGCEITDFEEDYVTYENKCDYCDYQSTSSHSMYHSSGTYTSSFTCPKCKKQNSIKIKTTSK